MGGAVKRRGRARNLGEAKRPDRSGATQGVLESGRITTRKQDSDGSASALKRRSCCRHRIGWPKRDRSAPGPQRSPRRGASEETESTSGGRPRTTSAREKADAP